MSFREDVLDICIEIQDLLIEKYQGSGKDFDAVIGSVERKLDPQILKKIYFIKTIRNKAAHTWKYKYDSDENQFLRTCNEVINYLKGRPNQRQSNTTTSKTTKPKPPGTASSSYKSSNSTSYTSNSSNTRATTPKPAVKLQSSTSRASQNKRNIPASYSFSWVMPVMKISLALVAIVIVFNVGRFVFYQIGGFFSRFSSSSGTQTTSSPQYNSNQTSYAKQVDCDQIFRKARKNKKVKIPSQCQDTSTGYQESQEKNRTVSFNKQENPQARAEDNEAQKHEAERQKAEQQKAEAENQQRLDAERREQAEQRQREEAAAMYRSMQENQRRAREQEQQQAETDRRNEEEAERKRAQARQDAAAREREKQRRTQENNDRLVRMGTELRDKIFKKKF